MATRQELSDFLAAAERRAFKQAVYAVRDQEVALDVVQDAMLKLASRYAERPPAELPLLFQRILQNTITDHFRRQKVRNLWTTPLSALAGGGDDDENGERDILEALEAGPDSPGAATGGAEQLERVQLLAILDEEIGRLPRRQREAFLLRYWEDLNVAETAEAMGCSEGSVKTHCSRAAHTLAEVLRARGIEP
jgi:RNA polymerase sigma-70 factor (ECF subfamily)